MSKKTDEIRKRIEKAEERRGRMLTTKERRKIEKNVILKYRRKNFIRGVLIAAGVTIGAGGHALLTDGNSKDTETKQEREMQSDDKKENNNTFKENLKFETNTSVLENEQNNDINYNEIITEILEEYNNKYSTDLSKNDISYIKSNPQYIGINEKGQYVQNYKENHQIEEVIRDNIKDIYIIINNKDNTIITSLGKVKSQIENIDTKIVKNSNGQEYIESDKKINLTENKKQDEIEQIYKALEDAYENEKEEER